jgi:hypothetical protein
VTVPVVFVQMLRPSGWYFFFLRDLLIRGEGKGAGENFFVAPLNLT